MKEFSGRIAVVTGGGSGMGRELVRQLVAEGCHVAMCDVSARRLAETAQLCQAAGLPQGVRVTSHLADVSREADVLRFRDEAAAQHATDRIHLLFNNAGISGGGSLIVNDRDEWERTFNICWGGVYFTTRAFLPLLRAADEAHLVNTSSINGFWASVGPDAPHTAYSAAKFAVKGFTEALIADFRMNAPHIKVSVVMPGHIGTGIRVNSLKVQTNNDSDELDAAQIAQVRARLASMGRDRIGAVGCGHSGDAGRTGTSLCHRRADQCGGGGDDHPGRREGGQVAHPGRSGRPRDRRDGPAGP